jgi:hypothetical protein
MKASFSSRRLGYRPRRYGWHIPRDHGAGGHQSVLADSDGWQQGGAGTDGCPFPITVVNFTKSVLRLRGCLSFVKVALGPMNTSSSKEGFAYMIMDGSKIKKRNGLNHDTSSLFWLYLLHVDNLGTRQATAVP